MKEAADQKQVYWLKEIVSLGLSVVGGLLMAYVCGSFLDPNREERKRNKKYADQLNRRLKRKLVLNPMEQLIADSVVNPDDIDVLPESIFGIDDVYQDLLNKAVRPLQLSGVFCTTLWRQTRGVLLYGRPGTGKTMLAKALAKSCGCFFMSISVASIQSKWYGDAQKLVRAIFTLAEKLQPCIVFIDEVDSFLTTRGGHSEHEASLSVKTEFMQYWEGMSTRSNTRILVMGTTNRRAALDPAVLRRFALQYEIPLPTLQQREAILEGYLRKHADETGLGVDVFDPNILASPQPVRDGLTPLKWIARETEGFSGSHLLEVCAQAAKRPVIDALVQAERDGEEQSGDNTDLKCRPCAFEDFREALNTVKPTLQATERADRTNVDSSAVLNAVLNSGALFAEAFVGGALEAATEGEDGQENGQNGRNGNNGRQN